MPFKHINSQFFYDLNADQFMILIFSNLQDFIIGHICFIHVKIISIVSLQPE